MPSQARQPLMGCTALSLLDIHVKQLPSSHKRGSYRRHNKRLCQGSKSSRGAHSWFVPITDSKLLTGISWTIGVYILTEDIIVQVVWQGHHCTGCTQVSGVPLAPCLLKLGSLGGWGPTGGQWLCNWVTQLQWHWIIINFCCLSSESTSGRGCSPSFKLTGGQGPLQKLSSTSVQQRSLP